MMQVTQLSPCAAPQRGRRGSSCLVFYLPVLKLCSLGVETGGDRPGQLGYPALDRAGSQPFPQGSYGFKATLVMIEKKPKCLQILELFFFFAKNG